MINEKSCGTIIIDQNEVLLIGAKDDDGKMFWSFPKGHQEDGETDIETALRETFEEVGLNVEIINQAPIIVSHHIHNGKDIKDIYLFPAKFKGGKIKTQAGEVELYRWVNFDEVDNYLLDYYKEAWHKARKMLGRYNQDYRGRIVSMARKDRKIVKKLAPELDKD